MDPQKYEEFHVIVNAYDLPPNESEIAWYNGVDVNLKAIARSTVGQAILYKIRSEGWLLIVPYTAEFARKNTHGSSCNAVTFMLPDSVKAKDRTAQVAFSASTYKKGSSCAASGPAKQPDSVLLHELVHAGRKLGLDARDVKLDGKLAGYENEEEFFAIVVQNIYVSEMYGRGAPLRGDHGNGQLAAPLDNAWSFMDVPENYKLVEKFCEQHTKVAPMIAKADARFNPIKVYYELQKDVMTPEIDLPTPREQIGQWPS